MLKLTPRIRPGEDNEDIFISSNGQEPFHLQAKDTILEQLTKNFYNLNNTEEFKQISSKYET
jgi:hypothetical protein